MGSLVTFIVNGMTLARETMAMGFDTRYSW